MNFKNIRFSYLLANLIIAGLFPVYKLVSSKNSSLLDFINAITITGLFFLIFGILYSLVLHGSLDSTEYVAKHALTRQKIKSFEDFKQDKEEEREGKFNYPLLVGILMLAIAIILTLCNY